MGLVGGVVEVAGQGEAFVVLDSLEAGDPLPFQELGNLARRDAPVDEGLLACDVALPELGELAVCLLVPGAGPNLEVYLEPAYVPHRHDVQLLHPGLAVLPVFLRAHGHKTRRNPLITIRVPHAASYPAHVAHHPEPRLEGHSLQRAGEEVHREVVQPLQEGSAAVHVALLHHHGHVLEGLEVEAGNVLAVQERVELVLRDAAVRELLSGALLLLLVRSLRPLRVQRPDFQVRLVPVLCAPEVHLCRHHEVGPDGIDVFLPFPGALVRCKCLAAAQVLGGPKLLAGLVHGPPHATLRVISKILSSWPDPVFAHHDYSRLVGNRPLRSG
mmetsp:Transcript_2298/g.4640  ORF Transcript_2298/g.4640 Transcript_2298/m.4640 type:complete len:328 (-) Transcript_2298:611-1594(-)